MQKFLKKVVILFFVMIIILFIVIVFDYFIIGSQYQYNYQASLIDKVNRLKSIDEPKIILVGNSNLSFGINSEKIEKSLEMPVVNLGLNAALGNAYHEQIAKLGINEGDIVVVCHSSFSDEDVIINPELAWITYDYNNELWPVIREKDYKSMLLAYPTYLKKSYLLWLSRQGNKERGDCYSRTAFNEYGDIVYRPLDDQIDAEKFFEKKFIAVAGINNVCIDRLNEFNKYCTEYGATLVVAGYPIAYGKYTEYTERDFVEFQEELEEKLDCNVISDYTDYFYPYSYFYNTEYHLTEEGTEVRTNQLISDLKKWRDKNNSCADGE